MPNKLKRRLSKYSALELIDALYLNNPIELFMGEPEHHYAFIKPEYIGLSEEELDRLVGKKDDRGHRLDVVKSELHPTHPSRGIFNEDGNIFRLTDKGMEDSNYTMFGAVDNDQDPQVVLSYQNGIVLPEWTVTPNGNYINNSYDNIRLNYKAGGGNMLEEDPPTAPKYPDVPTKEAVLAFLKAVDEYRRLKVLAENRLSKNLILPNGEELLRYADETDEQYENRYKTRLSVYNLNVERANKRFESRQLKIDDIVRDVNNNIGLVVEAPKVPFTGEAYKEAAEYERQKEVNKAHDYKNIFDATLTAAELGMSGASLLGAYANWKKWKDLTSLTNPTTAQLAKARIANLLLKALLPMLIGGTGIDAYLTYDALNNDDTPNTIYNGISMGLGALGSVGASDVFLNSRFHSPKIDRILDVLGITLNTGDFLKLGYDTYNSLTKEDNMKATGGALQTPLDWNELSMKEKAAYIRMGVANGYKDIDSIKNVYNEFKEGGNLYGGGSRKLSTTNSLTVLKVINYFMNKGLTDYLAAGLVGNLVRESQLNPNAVNKYSGAFGIALWLGPRKEKLFAKYGSKPTLDLQLDFAWHELNSSHKQGLRSLLASKTAEEAARNAMGYYEFQAGPEGAIREMNKYGLNGQASMDEGIRNAHNIMMNVSPDYRIQNKYPGLNPSIIQYKDLSLPNNSIPQFKYNGLTDYDKSFIVDDETLNKIMNLLSSNTPLGTNVVTPESLKLGVVGPEVVVTEQAPKYYVRPNPQELLDLMNSIMVPYELPEIPKPITATERLALLNKDRNTLLLQDLEDSILRANRLGTPLDEVKLARDVKDLQFYRNMASNGGNLFYLGGDEEELEVPNDATRVASIKEPVPFKQKPLEDIPYIKLDDKGASYNITGDKYVSEFFKYDVAPRFMRENSGMPEEYKQEITDIYKNTPISIVSTRGGWAGLARTLSKPVYNNTAFEILNFIPDFFRDKNTIVLLSDKYKPSRPVLVHELSHAYRQGYLGTLEDKRFNNESTPIKNNFGLQIGRYIGGLGLTDRETKRLNDAYSLQGYWRPEESWHEDREKQTTNAEVRYRLWKELYDKLGKIPTLKQTDDYIKNYEASKLLQILLNSNAYGQYMLKKGIDVKAVKDALIHVAQNDGSKPAENSVSYAALGGPLVDIINKYADGGLLDWLKQVFGLPIENSGTRVKVSKDSNGNYTFNGRKPAEGYTYYDGKTQNVYKFVNGKRTLLKLGESSKNTIRTYDIAKNIAHDDSIAKLTGWEGVPEGEMLNGLNRNKVYRNINPENRISIDNVIADGIRYGLDYHNWAGKRNTGSKGDEALFSRHLGRERNLEEMPITGIRFFGDYNSDGSYRLPNAEYTGIPNYAKRAISRGITEGSIDVDPTGEWTPVEENMYVHPGELTLYKNFSIRENNDSGIYDVFDTYDFPDNWWFPNLNRPEGKQIEVRDTVWGPNAIPELYDPSYTKQNISPISLILNKAFKKK